MRDRTLSRGSPRHLARAGSPDFGAVQHRLVAVPELQLDQRHVRNPFSKRHVAAACVGAVALLAALQLLLLPLAARQRALRPVVGVLAPASAAVGRLLRPLSASADSEQLTVVASACQPFAGEEGPGQLLALKSLLLGRTVAAVGTRPSPLDVVLITEDGSVPNSTALDAETLAAIDADASVRLRVVGVGELRAVGVLASSQREAAAVAGASCKQAHLLAPLLLLESGVAGAVLQLPPDSAVLPGCDLTRVAHAEVLSWRGRRTAGVALSPDPDNDSPPLLLLDIGSLALDDAAALAAFGGSASSIRMTEAVLKSLPPRQTIILPTTFGSCPGATSGAWATAAPSQGKACLVRRCGARWDAETASWTGQTVASDAAAEAAKSSLLAALRYATTSPLQ